MKFLRVITFPLMPFYYIVTWLRNKLYDLGLKSSKAYDFPVICVGNLSAGGTGKTPMIEYLIKLLKDDKKLATLSRGYGRNTKGFVLGKDNSDASILGDEPYQFYNKFANEIVVAVSEKRQLGIQELRALNPQPEVILLDDAFQHRKVKAGLNILLTTYSNLYTNDWVLPTGNLREPRRGAKRAQIIIVTKCPNNLDEKTKKVIVDKITPEAYQQVFFSSINYSEAVFNETESKTLKSQAEFTLVTGIANANPLVKYLNSKGAKFRHLNYKDHYNFTEKDIDLLSNEKLIVTTEKDFMRLKKHESLKGKMFYLPIEISIDRPDEFNKLVKGFVNS